MSDLVVDSSVVAKWILPEADSGKAHQLISNSITKKERLIVLDLAYPEVGNAIWKQYHRGLATLAETRAFLSALVRMPIFTEPALPLLEPALEIAMKYHRPIYDTLFVALSAKLGLPGITADEPLYTSVRNEHGQISLLRNT